MIENNSTLITLTLSLIHSIETVFLYDSEYTEGVLDSFKKFGDDTLFSYLAQEYGDDWNLHGFYMAYLAVKERLELLGVNTTHPVNFDE